MNSILRNLNLQSFSLMFEINWWVSGESEVVIVGWICLRHQSLPHVCPRRGELIAFHTCAATAGLPLIGLPTPSFPTTSPSLSFSALLCFICHCYSNILQQSFTRPSLRFVILCSNNLGK